MWILNESPEFEGFIILCKCLRIYIYSKLHVETTFGDYKEWILFVRIIAIFSFYSGEMMFFFQCFLFYDGCATLVYYTR